MRSVAQHREVFERLMRNAEREFARGQVDGAAGWSQLAAEYGWRNHTGHFTAARLEALLSEAALSVPDATSGSRHTDGTLHVVTDAARMGGHVNFITRWVRAQADVRHSLVVVAGHAVAPPLADAVKESGGEVTLLSTGGGRSSLARAGRLRVAARAHGRVMLHTDPHDAVPLLAFGAGVERPPVTFINHADHILWLGIGAADAVAHFRSSGAAHAASRRGVGGPRSRELPIPLPDRGDEPDRAAARAKLGLAGNEIVVITTASPYKYARAVGEMLPDLAAAALGESSRTSLYALGPTPDGAWAGRRGVRALGPRSDAAAWMAAADVYLDSFPLTSVTSLLEAAQHALPILRLDLGPVEAPELFHPGDPALDPATVTARSPREWRERLVELAADRALREQLGTAGREAVEATHCGSAWLERVAAVHDVGVAPPLIAADHCGDEAIDRALVALHASGGVDTAFLGQVPDHLAVIGGSRAANLARVARATRPDAPRFATRLIAAAQRRVGRRVALYDRERDRRGRSTN
jgi:hypothetical protein